MGGIGVLGEAHGEAGQPHVRTTTRAEAVSYFSSQLRYYSWGVAAARAFARHRLRRVIYVGAERLPRAAQLTGRAADGCVGHGPMASATAFQAANGMGAGSGGWR